MKKYLYSCLLMAFMAVLSFSLVSCDDDDDNSLSGGSGGYTGTIDGVTYSFTMNDISFKAVSWISYIPTLWIGPAYGRSYYEEFIYTIWGYVGEEGAALNFTIWPEDDQNELDLYAGKDITTQVYPSITLGDLSANWGGGVYVSGSVRVVSFTSENLAIQFNNFAWSVDKNPKTTVESIVVDGEISMDYTIEYN